MDSPPTVARDTIKDAIVTLPGWGIAAIAAIGLLSLGVALWTGVTSSNENIKTAAIQLLLVLVPLASAIVAAIAVRRTSTRQIDRLVTGFLEKTILEKFQQWCESPHGVSIYPYPFQSVRLEHPTGGRSYGYFIFSWSGASRASDARVGVKTNVFNFEVFSSLPIQIERNKIDPDFFKSCIVNQGNVGQVASHPVLKDFIGTIQGSVNEGYEVKIAFDAGRSDKQSSQTLMHVSLRQKVRENFLASPFLKRYFAEDAAIVIGVLFNEYRASAWFPPAP